MQRCQGFRRFLASCATTGPIACETYGAIDDATTARARWFATCRALADLVFAEQTARPEYLAAGLRALTWLRARGGESP